MIGRWWEEEGKQWGGGEGKTYSYVGSTDSVPNGSNNYKIRTVLGCCVKVHKNPFGSWKKLQ